MAHDDGASSAQLAHLKELPVHVARVLGRRVTMAEVIRSLTVSIYLNGLVDLVAEELYDVDEMEQLDGALGEMPVVTEVVRL